MTILILRFCVLAVFYVAPILWFAANAGHAAPAFIGGGVVFAAPVLLAWVATLLLQWRFIPARGAARQIVFHVVTTSALSIAFGTLALASVSTDIFKDKTVFFLYAIFGSIVAIAALVEGTFGILWSRAKTATH